MLYVIENVLYIIELGLTTAGPGITIYEKVKPWRCLK